jgi:hypothetical protein
MHSISARWRQGILRPIGLAAAAALVVVACQSQLQEGLGPLSTVGADTIPLAVETQADAWYQALEVSPTTATLAPGQSLAFKALNWQAGVSSPVTFPVAWSATGGTITGNGVFTAGSVPGTYQVTASGTTTSYQDQATVTIAASTATVSMLLLTPPSASLATGGSQQFSVSAVLSDGSTQADPAATWKATGGTISTSGLYQAGGKAGNYLVIATSGNGKGDTSAVTLSSPAATITALNLTPATVTVASGSSQQFAVSATLSDGTTQSNPSVTWTATGGTVSASGTYLAGSTAGTFRVIATAGNSRADTSTVTVTAPLPPPTSGGGSTLFSSDWRSGDLLDGGKWNRWGGQSILAVVPASGLGFPASMSNVMRVAMGTGSFDWIQANAKWTLPAVGESRAFRMYLRNNVGNVSGGWAATHPVESQGTSGSISGNFYAWHLGSNTDGTFPVAFADEAPWPRNYWTTSNATNSTVGTLLKQTTYRLEWKWTRTGSSVYTLDLRIIGADDRTVVADRTTIKAWGGGSLASNPGGIPVADQFMTGIRIGLNGGFSASGAQYVYYGGFAVCSDWCGAY